MERHRCKQKERLDAIDTPQFRAAYQCFDFWHKARGYHTPGKAEFVASKYFKPMMNFVDFSRKMEIPERRGYIQFAARMRLLPNFWCRDDIYAKFMSDFDKLYPPHKQFDLSIKTLARWANMFECEMHEVWKELRFNEILKSIEARKLSPWLVLNSQSFRAYLSTLTPRERIIFDTFIKKDTWVQTFKADPETTKSIISRLNDLKV